MFLHSEEVGQHLRRMCFICEPVPHWHTGIRGQFFYLYLGKTTILDAIVHPAEHTRGILHSFFGTDVRTAWAKVGDACTLVDGCYFKCNARSCRVFFENERNLLALQALFLCASVFCRFQVVCQL